MRPRRQSFDDLLKQNKTEILQDKSELAKIDQKIELKQLNVDYRKKEIVNN